MQTPDLFRPLTFARGPVSKNRLMLAPLTNLQSHPDGRLTDDEIHWLEVRAKAGFGFTMTAAAAVQPSGKILQGQLGIFSDIHLPGLTRMAAMIKAQGSVAVVQLQHSGMRAPADLIGETPRCPSANPEFNARAFSLAEVEQLIEDFITAALRAERAGFDGIELHGAHGYVITQFLSDEINRRDDRYGGSFDNRSRMLDEIIAGIRARCRPDFSLGLRLSGERWGVRLGEMLTYSQKLMREGQIDYLDMSLWDCFKEPDDPEFKGRNLMQHFIALERGKVRLGVCGHIRSGASAAAALAAGADFVLIGRAAILHHDFPERVRENPEFEPVAIPVTREYLAREGLGKAFIDYMCTFAGYVQTEEVVEEKLDLSRDARVDLKLASAARRTSK